MKTYEQLVEEYRKRQHDTVVDTIATGLTYVDEIAVDTGITILGKYTLPKTPALPINELEVCVKQFANNVQIIVPLK